MVPASPTTGPVPDVPAVVIYPLAEIAGSLAVWALCGEDNRERVVASSRTADLHPLKMMHGGRMAGLVKLRCSIAHFGGCKLRADRVGQAVN